LVHLTASTPTRQPTPTHGRPNGRLRPFVLQTDRVSPVAAASLEIAARKSSATRSPAAAHAEEMRSHKKAVVDHFLLVPDINRVDALRVFSREVNTSRDRCEVAGCAPADVGYGCATTATPRWADSRRPSASPVTLPRRERRRTPLRSGRRDLQRGNRSARARRSRARRLERRGR